MHKVTLLNHTHSCMNHVCIFQENLMENNKLGMCKKMDQAKERKEILSGGFFQGPPLKERKVKLSGDDFVDEDTPGVDQHFSVQAINDCKEHLGKILYLMSW